MDYVYGSKVIFIFKIYSNIVRMLDFKLYKCVLLSKKGILKLFTRAFLAPPSVSDHQFFLLVSMQPNYCRRIGSEKEDV